MRSRGKSSIGVVAVPSELPYRRWLEPAAVVAMLAVAMTSATLFQVEANDVTGSLPVAATGGASSTLAPLLRDAAALITSPLFYLMLGCIFLAEKCIPVDRSQSLLSRGFFQDFGTWFLLDAPLKGALTVFMVGVAYFAFDNYLTGLRLSDGLAATIPVPIRVLMAVLVGDLLKWLHHLLTHKIKFLWLFHSIHHSQRELNFFTDLRFHAFELVTLVPLYYTPLYLLNLDFQAAVWTALLIVWYPRIYHANLRTNFGPLRHLLVTPQSHRVHHSRETRHIDKNFGTIFSFWDRLFGTQWTDCDEYPQTGIADEEFPWEDSVQGTNLLRNYFSQLLYPFRKLIPQHTSPGNNRRS